LGFVPDEDLPALYKGAQFFIYPSLYEGFGMPVLEALSVGTPIAASQTSSIPEVAGDAALYFDPADAMAITSAMLHLLTDPNLRKILADTGKIQATKFSWQKFTCAVLEDISKVYGC
jgi:alpha-1,3-rhamnosyl/mannosyltransferase